VRVLQQEKAGLDSWPAMRYVRKPSSEDRGGEATFYPKRSLEKCTSDELGELREFRQAGNWREGSGGDMDSSWGSEKGTPGWED